MIKLNYLIKLLLLIFIFNILGRNICAVSEQNIISYSFLISKELINQIASDRFGDQSADFINEITKKNINISKLRINHEGSSISFIISFNSFNIDRGDKYMIDKALTLPITEQITFDKYFMYSMVSKDYKPNLEDAKKIIDKDGRKIMLGKLGDDYEIVFKMKFRVNVDAILKNDQNQTWIIETPWEENDMDLYKNNSVSKEAFSGKSQDEILSYKAKAYVEAQKKREEEDSRREEELKAQYEKELMEKARIAKEMKHREEALKKLEEEKEKKEEEKQKSKEEQKRKDEEEKQKVQEEAARKKAQLLVEAKKRE
ncbi:MAG: hypothetical protein HY934_07530 [Candidatus Firestonebacteria bacterium]|nr:hypothetical protein [Candidatus Firestonebacteria bacterium]